MRRICRRYRSDVPIEHKYFFIKAVLVFSGFPWKKTPFMKEMYRILKFINLESSTFEKGFLCTSNRFFFIRGLYSLYYTFFDFKQIWRFTQASPISFKFNSDKNIISRREDLKTKELYVRQISDRARTLTTISKTEIYS